VNYSIHVALISIKVHWSELKIRPCSKNESYTLTYKCM